MFAEQAVQGQISKQMELAGSAPISGAPVPGTGTNAAPLSPSAPVSKPGIMAAPFEPAPKGVAFYRAQARMWGKLANLPGASEQVAQHAKDSRLYYNKVKRGEV